MEFKWTRARWKAGHRLWRLNERSDRIHFTQPPLLVHWVRLMGRNWEHSIWTDDPLNLPLSYRLEKSKPGFFDDMPF